MPRTTFPALLSAVLVAALPLVAQTSAYPTNEQLRHFRSMGDPRLAPDGKHILLRITDATADGAKSHLWLTAVHGEEPRQLTYSPEGDKRGEHDGEWMPDGNSILFLAKRGEHMSLFRLPMNGGEAKAFDLKIMPPADEAKLPDALPPKAEMKADGSSLPAAQQEKSPSNPAELPIDVSHYRISPDGKWIALLAADPETPGEKAQKEAKADAVWVDHGIHGARLYLLHVETSKLTPVPIEPDLRDMVWSKDSSKLLAIAEGMNNVADLAPANSGWIVSLADPNHPEKLPSLPSSLEAATWSPDGHSLAYLAQAKHDTPPGYADLYLYDAASRTSRNLSDGWKGSLRNGVPVFLKDGGLLTSVQVGFEAKAARLNQGESQPQILSWPGTEIASIATNDEQNGWLFISSSAGTPSQLYYADALTSVPATVKTPPLVPEHLSSTAPKKVQWKSDSFSIEGRLYLPPDAADKHVPLIVEVHGGPLGAYTEGFDPWIDFLLGQGWAVLRTNPRGSSGYGAAFAAANKNDLGGGDYRDIMAGVDAVLKTEPLDSSRMALIGYSYGGEMAGFVEGKTTRFRAIVSGAPVIDQHSEYGTESSSWYDRWYFGKPWEHPEDAWRQSPLALAGKAKTPFLLLQGESDTTDPLGQAQEMYRALRQMGVPVDLVTYPRDNHGPLAQAIYGRPVPEPWHGYDARRRIVNFIQKAFASASSNPAQSK